MRREMTVLLGLMAISTVAFAQSETITIRGHSRRGNPPGQVALLSAELDGDSVVLRCVLSHADCKELPKGQYNIERLLDGEGSYPGCSNVDIFRLGRNSFQEEPLGEYCLLSKK